MSALVGPRRKSEAPVVALHDIEGVIDVLHEVAGSGIRVVEPHHVSKGTRKI